MSRAIMLTGTIDTGTFGNTNVKLTDTELRLEQYEQAIQFYIYESQIDYIVFVENSGYKFDAEKYEKMALKVGKEFEFVPIATDYEKTVRLGKSFGEGDCIEQGVNKSRLLGKVQSFYKVTGRVIVRNINALLDNDDRSRFVFRNDLNRCYTVFFKMNREMFLEYFMDCKSLCDEQKDIDIETVFHQIVVGNNLDSGRFKQYPKYDGTIGTLGVPYNDSEVVWIVKTVLCKFGFYSKNANKFLLDMLAKQKVKRIVRK